jgi:hypothetical protein
MDEGVHVLAYIAHGIICRQTEAAVLLQDHAHAQGH